MRTKLQRAQRLAALGRKLTRACWKIQLDANCLSNIARGAYVGRYPSRVQKSLTTQIRIAREVLADLYATNKETR